MSWIAGYNIIDDLLDRHPELAPFIDQEVVTSDWLIYQKKLADDYVRLAERSLSGTHWFYELKRIIGHAANEADRQIAQMSANKVPAGMDRLDLRPYVIAKTQCDWTIEFLWRQKHEGRQTLNSLINQLQEQIARRRQPLA